MPLYVLVCSSSLRFYFPIFTRRIWIPCSIPHPLNWHNYRITVQSCHSVSSGLQPERWAPGIRVPLGLTSTSRRTTKIRAAGGKALVLTRANEPAVLNRELPLSPSFAPFLLLPPSFPPLPLTSFGNFSLHFPPCYLNHHNSFSSCL